MNGAAAKGAATVVKGAVIAAKVAAKAITKAWSKTKSAVEKVVRSPAKPPAKSAPEKPLPKPQKAISSPQPPAKESTYWRDKIKSERQGNATPMKARERSLANEQREQQRDRGRER